MKDKMKYFKSGIIAFIMFPYILFVSFLGEMSRSFNRYYQYHEQKIEKIVENARSKIWD